MTCRCRGCPPGHSYLGECLSRPDDVSAGAGCWSFAVLLADCIISRRGYKSETFH